MADSDAPVQCQAVPRMRARLLRWSAILLGGTLATACLLNPKTDDLPGAAFSPSDEVPQPVPTSTGVTDVGPGAPSGLGASPEPGDEEVPGAADAGTDLPSDAGADQ